jgi:ketosteroid isomerase-like protein
MSDERVYPRAEVEEAFHAILAAGDAGDWDRWSDLHTEDCVWVEHHYGTIVGRDAIRSTITALMAPVPMMRFPVEWFVIDGNRVVYYPWQVFPDPAGGDAEYRFGCVTVLEYAGDGRFSRQEDVYNPNEGEAVVTRWLQAGGQLAGDPSALGIDA